jgi:cytochrome c oxidase cbb3-type subunit 3
LFAEDAPVQQVEMPKLPDWALDPNVYLLGFLFFVLVLTIIVLLKVNTTLLKVISPGIYRKPEKKTEILDTKKKSGVLRKIYLRMVDSVPVSEEKDVLMDHDYDGIRELDNNLPPWWKYGFYITIVFAFVYLLVYHVSGAGKLSAAEYKEELAVAEKQKEERSKLLAENITDENVIAITDASLLENGKGTFQKFCAACHRPDGGGQVGPNLTDDYWLHGGGIKNIFHTITNGVPAKGMISWKSQLSAKQIQQVASYVLTLHGTNSAGGKGPQGDKWVEEVAAAPDSSKMASADTLAKKI